MSCAFARIFVRDLSSNMSAPGDSSNTPADATHGVIHAVRAVAMSWHGVLFDRGRRAIHGATRATFARWQVALTDAELEETRGPAGRPQILRLFALPSVSEAFRRTHGRWVTSDDIAAMMTDLEPRLVEAARIAQEPNQDACDAIRRLHARGVRTAVICCTQRRLLGPQLEALERAGVPIDVLVTADEACEPAPAPWGIFEAVRLLGIDGTGDLALLDDCDDGVRAAQNAGAIAISVRTEGGSPAAGAAGAIRSLDEVG